MGCTQAVSRSGSLGLVCEPCPVVEYELMGSRRDDGKSSGNEIADMVVNKATLHWTNALDARLVVTQRLAQKKHTDGRSGANPSLHKRRAKLSPARSARCQGYILSDVEVAHL